ncbi:MAG: hypothetical protein GF334_01875 [Candidatus Altiarchaeales archaeon]|nr:hypothetical protein [Candidatus Altiarchaeales archaeon]
MEDDRRTQAGSTTLADTHKVVLNSNGGESGTSPNWFLTLVSGTGSSPGDDNISVQIATAYDSGTHAVPASGVANVDTTSVSSLDDFDTDSDGYNALFIAADKDSVSVFNNHEGDSWGILCVGKPVSFFDEDFEPYSLYIKTDINVDITGNSWLGIVGNPPETITNNGDGAVLTYTNLTDNNEPRRNLGNNRNIFTGVPLLWAIDDASPSRKGAMGFVRHVFGASVDSAGIPLIGKLINEGTGQEFICFSSTNLSIFLRAS